MIIKKNIKSKSKRPKIAIIGSGISGISSAFLLSKKYDIDLYEENTHFGGHAFTMRSNLHVRNGELDTIYYDIGFLVYNDKNYPNFKKLLQYLKVRNEKSNMSFSVSNKSYNFEYGSRGLMAFTNNLKNIFSLNFWKMVFDIIKFNFITKNIILSGSCKYSSVLDFFNKNRFSEVFISKYFVPMCGAIWSTSQNNVMKMPLLSILFFLNNHGLLNLINRPKWRTITNGSHNYVKEIIKKINGKIYNNEKIRKVTRLKDFCLVEGKNFKRKYENVVFAIHSEDILKVLTNPSKPEKEFFSLTSYEINTLYVHKDDRLMPSNTKVWSSWNVLLNENKIKTKKKPQHTCVTYWINKLQNIKNCENIFVTLNPLAEYVPEKDKIIRILKMKHPLMKKEIKSFQAGLNRIQGKDRIYYVGAWTGYGFHEDGLKSAINLAKLFGIQFDDFIK